MQLFVTYVGRQVKLQSRCEIEENKKWQKDFKQNSVSRRTSKCDMFKRYPGDSEIYKTLEVLSTQRGFVHCMYVAGVRKINVEHLYYITFISYYITFH
jgi:hypothetical protein